MIIGPIGTDKQVKHKWTHLRDNPVIPITLAMIVLILVHPGMTDPFGVNLGIRLHDLEGALTSSQDEIGTEEMIDKE